MTEDSENVKELLLESDDPFAVTIAWLDAVFRTKKNSVSEIAKTFNPSEFTILSTLIKKRLERWSVETCGLDATCKKLLEKLEKYSTVIIEKSQAEKRKKREEECGSTKFKVQRTK